MQTNIKKQILIFEKKIKPPKYDANNGNNYNFFKLMS